MYDPRPIDTSMINLDIMLMDLLELLAQHAHDVWAMKRIQDGWSWGPERCDESKRHPCLVPYEELPETEKEYDRALARETLKVIVALGFQISCSAQQDAAADCLQPTLSLRVPAATERERSAAVLPGREDNIPPLYQ